MLWCRLTKSALLFLLKRSPMSDHEHHFTGQYTIWSTDCFRCKANKTWMFRINDIEAVWKGIYIVIRSWINNHTHCFIWDVITHPYHNFNGGLTTAPVDCVNRSPAELFYSNMIYICIFLRKIEIAKWFLLEYKESFVLQNQYNGCWWPGDTRSKGFNSHRIDRLLHQRG